MSIKSNRLRAGIAALAAVGITGALLAASPLAATASETVVTFDSTNAADYPYLMHTGGGGGTDWAPWPDSANLNAGWVTGEDNWFERAGWGGHNFAVQDDTTSSDNNALWVHKAEAGCKSSGIQVAKTTNGSSLISSANKVITLKVKAANGDVPIEATLTDIYGGQTLKVIANATENGVYNTVSFDFANATTGSYLSNYSYTTLSLVFDPENAIAGAGHDDWAGCGGTGATASKVYIVDDLTYTEVAGADPAPAPDTPRFLTYEPTDTLGTQAAGAANDNKWAGSFGSGGSGIANPPVKRTGKALEFNKAGGDLWTGLNLVQAPAGQVITSAAGKVISFDYYSPNTVNSPVSIKLIATDNSAVRAVFSAKKGWQTFVIDMGTLSGVNGVWSADKTYTQLVLYPNWADPDIMPAGLANAPMGSKYYIDNVIYNGFGLPTKTGTVDVASVVLTAGSVTWTGRDVVTAFKWYRCSVEVKAAKNAAPTSAEKCTAITGATGNTYTIVAADKGKFLRVASIGTTSAGSVQVTSKSTKIG